MNRLKAPARTTRWFALPAMLASMLGVSGTAAPAHAGVIIGQVASTTASGFANVDSTGVLMGSRGAASVSRTGAGTYVVTFANMASGGGVVHVTARGDGSAATSNSCQAVSWRYSGTWVSPADENINVSCFDTSGRPSDTGFTVSYNSRPNLSAPQSGDFEIYDYLWADQPTAAGYTPSPMYQYNSVKSDPILRNTVNRLSTGSWVVHLLGRNDLPYNAGRIDYPGGEALVTAYGPTPTRCRTAGIVPNHTTYGQDIYVLCHDYSGNAVDARFSLSYAHYNQALIPQGTVFSQGLVLPSSGFDTTNSEAPGGTVTKYGTGEYLVSLPDVGKTPDSFQLTPNGWNTAYCSLSSWSGENTTNPAVGGTVQAWVDCFSPSGQRADTSFFVAYTGNVLIIG